MAAYHQAGITSDPRTWARPAPLLPAIAAALRAARTKTATGLADRLVPFAEGIHAAFFAAPTTTRPPRAPGRVLPARRSGRAAPRRDPPGLGHSLAAGHRPGLAPPGGAVQLELRGVAGAAFLIPG